MGCVAANAPTQVAVRSVDPSSTTSTSTGSELLPCETAESIEAAIVAAALYAGMTMLTCGGATTSDTMRPS